MKKKIIAAIVTATLLLTGCSDMANVSVSEEQDNTEDTIVQVEDTMMQLENGWEYRIYADKDTGVMYLYTYMGRNYGGGLTVMLNADGTPKIWQGEE